MKALRNIEELDARLVECAIDYFEAALARTESAAIQRGAERPGAPSAWKAGSIDSAPPLVFDAAGDGLKTNVGVKAGGVIRMVNARRGFGLYGPYITLTPGAWIARLYLEPAHARCGRAAFDVSAESATIMLGFAALDLDLRDQTVVELPIYLDRALSGIETRLFCAKGACMAIQRVEFERRQLASAI